MERVKDGVQALVECEPTCSARAGEGARAPDWGGLVSCRVVSCGARDEVPPRIDGCGRWVGWSLRGVLVCTCSLYGLGELQTQCIALRLTHKNRDMS